MNFIYSYQIRNIALSYNYYKCVEYFQNTI